MQEVSASSPSPPRAEPQHERVTFRLNLWDQISSDLEYLTDFSSTLKVYLLLAYRRMNVTAFMVHFSMHPSTACDNKIRSALISPYDTLLWWDEHSHRKVPYFMLSNVSGGLSSCEDDENKKFCGQSTRQAHGPPGPPVSPVSPVKVGRTARQTPALPSPRPSSHVCSWPLRLGASASLGTTETTLPSLCPAALPPLTPGPSASPSFAPALNLTPNPLYLREDISKKHHDCNLSSESTPSNPMVIWAYAYVDEHTAWLLHCCPLFSSSLNCCFPSPKFRLQALLSR